jgi:DNA-binding SARP family transcriptional activator
MMQVYAARGRRDLLNRQYGRLRQVLLSELGVEPSAATLEVYNSLLS